MPFFGDKSQILNSLVRKQWLWPHGRLLFPFLTFFNFIFSSLNSLYLKSIYYICRAIMQITNAN